MAKLMSCPDCGNQVSKSAPSCPKCGRVLKRQPAQYGCCGSIVILGALGLLALFVMAIVSPRPPEQDAPAGPTAKPIPPAPQVKPTHVGDLAVIDPKGGGFVTLAVDDAAWDEMIDAQNANSPVLLDRLVEQGRAFREAKGNRVLVIKTSAFSRFVRVVHGAHDGAEGWVQMEFLRPLIQDEAEE